MADQEVVETLGQIRDCLREIMIQLVKLNNPPMVVSSELGELPFGRPGEVTFIPHGIPHSSK